MLEDRDALDRSEADDRSDCCWVKYRGVRWGVMGKIEDNFAGSGEEVEVWIPSRGPARAEMGVIGGAGLR